MNFYDFFNKTILDNYEIYYEPLHNIRNTVPSKYDYSRVLHIIKKNPDHAERYAKYVMCKRWPDAEHIIKRSIMWVEEYETAFGIEL
jgi:hypothetical protein